MEISLPSIKGDLFVTFDHVKLMSFLMNCGECHIPVFLCASFRNFHLVEATRILLVS